MREVAERHRHRPSDGTLEERSNVILVFRCYAGEAPTPTLVFYQQFPDADSYTDPTEPGEYVVYESKGKADKYGVQPRFEVQPDFVKVSPPTPPSVSKVKALG
jgi:hypothetical protein